MNRLEIIQGDITKSDVDAIVNAANCSLLGGGGVDGAIHMAAGTGLLNECRGLNGCRTGEAKITRGYRLPARHVIHTPGPRWRDGQHGEPELLASCYRNCLRLASENGCHTVDFPSISTGIYHFPLDQAAQIAVREITAYLADHPEITRVRMVCFDSRTRAAYAAALAAQECAGWHLPQRRARPHRRPRRGGGHPHRAHRRQALRRPLHARGRAAGHFV